MPTDPVAQWQALAVSSSTFSAIIAKALGVLQGLQFAKDSGLLPTILETNAIAVVNAMNSAPSLDDLGLIVLDIQNVLSLFPDSSVMFVLRLANQATHILTRFALSVEGDYF
ncbi:hypothetical protein ACOSQ3_018999 [Xanthoceras sorbifolium]